MVTSLRADGPRERAPDGRLREAIRKQELDWFVASLLAMTVLAAHTTVILRSRALARRLEGWLTGFSCPSFEARREGRRTPQDDGNDRRHSGAFIQPKLNERTRNPEQCTMLDSGSAPKRAHPGMTETFTSSQDDGGSGLTTGVAGMRATELRSPGEQY
jgi:hypothetical protein